MQPKIEMIKEKKLVGLNLKMSLVENRTGELWQTFGPRRKEIQHAISNDRISLQIYNDRHFNNFSSANEFVKWACVEVSDFNFVPEGMQTLVVPSGNYAVFHYKGSSNDPSIFRYIFSEWLPSSNFKIANRPHFEVLGDKYKNAHPNSEEEIYVPIEKKI